MSENDRLPGWPYFLAALFIVFAYRSARDLPDQNCQSTYYSMRPPMCAPSRSIDGFSQETTLLYDSLMVARASFSMFKPIPDAIDHTNIIFDNHA